VTKWVLIYQK